MKFSTRACGFWGFGLVAIIGFCSTASATGQYGLNYDQYTHITYTFQDHPDAISNTPQKIVIDGDWAFVAIDYTTPGFGVGGRFYTIDISDPGSPVAHVPPGIAATRTRDFAVANDHLVVMGSESGGGGGSNFLDSYDVSDPTNWIKVAHVLNPGADIYTSLVGLTDSHAYLFKYPDTIQVYSMPNLSILNSFSTGFSIQKMIPSADGNHLFVLGDGDLHVYSLTDPVNPQWVVTHSASGAGLDMAYDGTLMHLAIGAGGAEVIDVSNPAVPVYMATIASQFAEVSKVAVDRFNPGNTSLFLGSSSEDEIEIVDIANVNAPVSIQIMENGPSTGEAWFDVKGDALFWTGNKLRGYELASFALPPWSSEFQIPHPTKQLVAFGDDMFLTSGDLGLSVVDVSIPLAPVITGTATLPFWAVDFVREGNFAYVLGSGGVAIVDLNDPANPQVVGSYVCSGVGLDVSGSLLAVASGAAGLEIVDISNPASPVSLGTYVDFNDEIIDVFLEGGLAFMAMAYPDQYGSYYSFGVIDLADPANPALVDQTSTIVPFDKVHVENGRAFLHGLSQLIHFDVSNPLSPQLVEQIGLPEIGNEITIVDDLIYLADGSKGVQIVQFSDTDPLRLFGNLPPMAGNASGVIYMRDSVFAANGTDQITKLPPNWRAVVSDVPAENPALTHSLSAAYPNPFNPTTTIAFELVESAQVSLQIYDVAGRQVRTLVDGELIGAGRKEVVWRGRDKSGRRVASGTYFYRLDAGEHSETRRMVMVK